MTEYSHSPEYYVSDNSTVYYNPDWSTGNYPTTEAAPPLYQASPAIIAVLAVFYGSISLLALVGNSLVVLVIVSNKRMQSVTNFLLANLASSDILIAVAAVPFQFQAALLQRWVLPDFMCIVAPFVQVLSVNVSIFTLTIISIERYRALLYPFKSRITKSAAGYAIAVIWIVAIVCAAPMAATLRVELFDNPVTGHKFPFCFPSGLATPANDSKAAKDEALEQSANIFRGYVVFLVAIQFMIPLVIISFAYITIALHLWGSHGPGEQNQQNLIRTKQRQKVIKMLILVVVLFAFCWLPLQAYNFLTAVIPHINLYPFINIIWFCCNFLAMSNSCQNPFILGLYNEKFRRELRAKFALCFCLRRSASSRSTITNRNGTCIDQTNVQTNGHGPYSTTRLERVRRSGTRCATQGQTPNDSPLFGTHGHDPDHSADIRYPLDHAEYYD